VTTPATFLVPADYFLAVVDAAYPSFLGTEWTLDTILAHFTHAAAGGTLLAWYTGSYGNWRVEVRDGWGAARGFREVTARLTATGDRLHLISYDDLVWAACYADHHLPRPGEGIGVIPVTPGPYDLRVVQLYDPAEADTEAVFYQEAPHFALEIRPGAGPAPAPPARVPWAEFGASPG